MSRLFYTIFLFFYSLAIKLASIWNTKAKLWVLGRSIFPEIENKKNKKIIWMHCASLGEFEQGRFLLEEIKKKYNNYLIVLTFFSPSGYEVVKNKTIADYIFYLPMDNFINAKKFIENINPTLVLWVKYEYWYYYLQELKLKNIPVLLISGVFRKSQPFFKWYGFIWKKMLHNFTHFFVQFNSSKKILSQLNFNNITVSGDTRFDSVINNIQNNINEEIFISFCKNSKVIVAGSTWEDDEIILAAFGDETKHKIKLIIVPHEIDDTHIDFVKKVFKNSMCYSEIIENKINLTTLPSLDTLIVDKMGILSTLYKFGDINYIGGGFTNDGIHNILEAAVWGKPIVMGENYSKYEEAIELIYCKAAESICDVNELKEVVDNWLNDTTFYYESATAAKNYVYKNKGATNIILNYIEENRFLTI